MRWLFPTIILLAALLISTNTAVATVITVDDSGGADHTTIQAAINAATGGDTIQVAAGTYVENVVVNESVTLQGASSSTTIIDGFGSGNVVEVTVNGVTIDSFRIQNGSKGFYVTSDNNVFSYNVITDMQGSTGITPTVPLSGSSPFNGGAGESSYGFYLLNSDNNDLTGNSISNIRGGRGGNGAPDDSAKTYQDGHGGTGGLSSGIYLSNSNSNSLSGNTIINLYGGNGGTGGSTYGTDAGGNGGTGGQSWSIYLSGSQYNNVSGNSINNIRGGTGGTATGYSWRTGGTGGHSGGIYLLNSINNYFDGEGNTISGIYAGAGGSGGGSGQNCAGGNGGNSFGVLISNSVTNNITGITFSQVYAGNGGQAGNHYAAAPGNSGAGGHSYGLYFAGTSSSNNIIYTTLSTIRGGNGANGVGTSSYGYRVGGTGGQSSGAYFASSSSSNNLSSNSISSITGGTGGKGAFGMAGGVGGFSSGLYLTGSNSNDLNNNIISNIKGGTGGTGGSFTDGATGGNSRGIYLLSSTGNTFIENTVTSINGGNGGAAGGGGISDPGPSGNDYGIYLQTSPSNTLYHNYFNSNPNGYDDNSSNTWDNGYPSGGNRWSDYAGVDGNGDGIGDTNYPISGPGGAVDNYPLKDSANPVINSVTINDTLLRTGDPLLVNVSATDGSEISSVTADGVSLTLTGGYYVGTIPAGTSPVTVVVTDDWSNSASDTTAAYTIDDDAPTISSVTINGTVVQTGTLLLVNVSATDAHTIVGVDADGVSLTLNGGYYTGIISASTSPVTVNVTDEVGNIATNTSAVYTIDDNAPTITSITLDDYVVQTGTILEVNVSVTDANTIVNVTADGTTLAFIGGNYTGTILANTGTVTVVATDEAGNTVTNTSATYTIDNSPPIISSVTLNDSVIQSGTQIQVNVSVTDTNTIVNVTADGVTLALISGNYTGIITANTSPVTIVATDEAGNVVTDTSTAYTIDNNPPAISSVTLNDTVIQTGAPVQVNVNVSDVNAIVNVTADGVLLTLSGGNYTGTIIANTSPVTVVATDEAGNTANDTSAAYTIDNTPPTISAVSLNDTVIQTGALVQVNVSVTDTNVIASVTADGVTLTLTGGYYTGNINANTSPVVVIAADEAGNSANNTSAAYTIDNTPPTISAVSINDTVIQTGAPIQVNVSTSDANTIVSVTADGVNLTLAGGNYKGIIPANSSPVTVVVTDEAGNAATNTSAAYVIDNTPPTIGSVTLNDTVIQTGIPIQVNVTASDANVIVSITADGVPLTLIGGNYTGTIISNTSPVTVVATDEAGNVATDTSAAYIIDNTPPVISAILLNDTVIQTGEPIEVNVSAADVNAIVNVTADGVTLSLSGGYYIGTINANTSPVTVVATDEAGNVATNTSAGYIIDNTPPAISSVNLNDTVIQTGASIRVNIITSDDNAIVSVTADGVALSLVGGNYTGTINANISPVTVVVTDDAGNAATDTSAVYIIDNTPPTINSVMLDDTIIQTGAPVQATVNATDTNAITNVTADGIMLTLSGGNYTGTIPANTSPVTVVVTDEAGNSATDKSANYTIDDIVPMITITSPAEGLSTSSVSVVVRGEVNGTGSIPNVSVNNVPVDISFNGGGQNGTYAVTVSLSAGTNLIYANATDEADNTNSTSINVTRTISDSWVKRSTGSSGEDAENIVFSQTEWKFVVAGKSMEYGFDQEDSIVIYIRFDSLTSSGSVQARVEMLDHTSSLVHQSAPGTVFRNMNILVGNREWGTDSNIKDPVIGFKVYKTWIDEYNIDPSGITMYHYDDGQWNPLVTTRTGEDDGHLYFEAQTPGFSPFAIIGTEMGATEVSTPAAEIPEDVTAIPSTTPVTTDGKSKGISTLVALLIVIFTLGAAVYFMKIK